MKYALKDSSSKDRPAIKEPAVATSTPRQPVTTVTPEAPATPPAALLPTIENNYFAIAFTPSDPNTEYELVDTYTPIVGWVKVTDPAEKRLYQTRSEDTQLYRRILPGEPHYVTDKKAAKPTIKIKSPRSKQ